MADVIDILVAEWPLFAGAPLLATGGAIIVGLATWTAAWKLKSSIDDGVLAAARERMQLAGDRERYARDKFHRLEGEFQELMDRVETGASKGELGPVTARLNATLEEVKSANTALQQVIERDPELDMKRALEQQKRRNRVYPKTTQRNVP